ncbi:MAG: hypothetical protein L0215_25840 [Gemmataceae bacterium]|nr:hypothetical protein [Gemmataceae bacterium]
MHRESSICRLLLVSAVFCLLSTVPCVQGQTASTPQTKKKEKKKDETFRVVGQLAPTDPIDKTRGGGDFYHKVHLYKMTPGKTYIIEMIDRNSRGSMDPWLRLENSSGTHLMHDDDGAGNLNSRMIFTPTVEDEYRIIAGTCSAGRFGSYMITAVPVPPGALLPAQGQSLVFSTPVEFGDIIVTPLNPFGVSLSGGGNDVSHGYVEYRFLVENTSQTQSRTVKLTMPRWRNRNHMGAHLRFITDTADVSPNSAVTVSLLQPDLPLLSANEVEVNMDGTVWENGVNVQSISNRGLRLNPFSIRSGPSAPLMHILVAGSIQPGVQDLVQVSAVGLPVVSLPNVGNRGGFFQRPGHPLHGQRYVYSEIHRLHAARDPVLNWTSNWLGYSSYEGVVLTGKELHSAPQKVQDALWRYVECGGSLLVVGSGAKVPDGWERTRAETKELVGYYPGFGQCFVADKTEMKDWDPETWRQITHMWEASFEPWRNIRSPNQAHREFPVVDNLAIPIRGLFVAMFLFVVVIGPLNFYWLARKRRKLWLLWTVPVLSIFTCALLFGYMLLREGWHAHLRQAGVTVLDETSQRATTVGWIGYYSPTSAGGGLRFSDETELTPQLIVERYFSNAGAKACSVDWSDGQHLEGNWITARVPMHFMVRRTEKRLERIMARKNPDGTVSVTNGLKADLASLALADGQGRVYTATGIKAGAEATLREGDAAVWATAKEDALRDFFRQSWLPPMEAMRKTPGIYLRPGWYLAVLDDNPFLEQGLSSVQSRAAEAVVLGIMKEPL